MITSILIKSNDQFGSIYFWTPFEGHTPREAIRRAKEEYSGTHYQVIDYREGKLSSNIMHQIFHSDIDAVAAWDNELIEYHCFLFAQHSMH